MRTTHTDDVDEVPTSHPVYFCLLLIRSVFLFKNITLHFKPQESQIKPKSNELHFLFDLHFLKTAGI